MPYGDLGTVGIDLSTAVAKFLLLPPGITIDTVPIPNDPALAGLPLFAQAVFFGDGDPRLSGTVAIGVLP